MLKNSGIDFEKFEKFGIDIQYFGELLMMSGLVLNDEIKWLSFHSNTDFAYLLKTLTCCQLPNDEASFLDLLTTYFPNIYDVKYIMATLDSFHGGLNALADLLKVVRVGPTHQAGSDSLLTAQVYFAVKEKYTKENIEASR